MAQCNDKVGISPRRVQTTTVATMAALKTALNVTATDVTELVLDVSTAFTITETLKTTKGIKTTLQTKSGTATIELKRGAAFTGRLFDTYTNSVSAPDTTTFVLQNIILDGNKSSVPNADSLLYVGGTTIINAGTILRNNIGHKGACIYMETGQLIINDGTFSDNDVTSKAGDTDTSYGGAIYISDGTSFILKAGLFTNNRALKGAKSSASAGAICVFKFHGDIIFGDKDSRTGPVFLKNTSEETMGAVSIYSLFTGSFTMYGGEFTENSAPTMAGALAVMNSGSTTLTNCYIKGGLFKKNKSGLGGAVVAISSTAAMNTEIGDPAINERYAPEFDSNEATYTGGALYVQSGAKGSMTFWLRRAYVHDNISKDSVGGIYTTNCVNIIGDKKNEGIIQPQITRNTAATECGGVGIYDYSSLKFISGSISYNKAKIAGGMGVYYPMSNAVDPVFEMGREYVDPPPEIVNNDALGVGEWNISGGGLWDGALEFRMYSGKINNNTAVGNGGGLMISGVALIGGDDPSLAPTIKGNKSDRDGGGIAIFPNPPTAKLYIATETNSKATIMNNTAKNMGGGISTTNTGNNDDYLKNIYIGKGAIFSGNMANRANYYIDDRQQEIYDDNINLGGFSRAEPSFRNAYNNYDIGYSAYRVQFIGCDGSSIYQTVHVRQGQLL